MTYNLFVLITYYFLLGVVNFSHSFKNSVEVDSSVYKNYPSVFYIDVPADAYNEEFIIFLVQQLDFLGAKNDTDNLSLRLSFLVHTEYEYLDLARNANNLTVVKDISNTEIFQNATSVLGILNQPINTISGYPCYRNVNGIFAMMNSLVSLAKNSKPNLHVSIIDIGNSFDKNLNAGSGYDIKVLKVTGDRVAKQGMKTEKGILFIITGVHAREFAPPELVARWIQSLIQKYGSDTDITSILDHTEIHLILESNPDGRYIAETFKLYWRKNTRIGCSISSSRGVDLNRNYPFGWGLDSGSSSSSCSSSFRGASAASEPEIKAIISYARKVFPPSQRNNNPNTAYPEDKINGVFLDIHAYGEIVIWPWAFKYAYAPNEVHLQAMARKITSYNKYDLAGPFQPDFLYLASGSSADWAYGELGAMSFIYELGTSFFQDCSTFENSIYPRNMPSLTYAARVAARPYILSKGPDIMSFNLSPQLLPYSPSKTITISITVSDSARSAGSNRFSTASQTIRSIKFTVDMHPYDLDANNRGPAILTANPQSTSNTITQTISYKISVLALRGNLSGKHVIYAYGTDSAGYDGPVVARSFTITSVQSPTNKPTVAPTKKPTVPSAEKKRIKKKLKKEKKKLKKEKKRIKKKLKKDKKKLKKKLKKELKKSTSSPTTIQPNTLQPTVTSALRTASPSKAATTSLPTNEPSTFSPTLMPTNLPSISPSILVTALSSDNFTLAQSFITNSSFTDLSED